MARSAALAGRTVSDLIRAAFILALLVAVGFAIGFCPQTNLAYAVVALAVALTFVYAWSWVIVVVGLILRIFRRTVS